MKRILCLLMVLCLTAGVMAPAARAAGEDLRPYLPALQEAQRTDREPELFGEALFYDLDGQAPREMILVRAPDGVHAVVEVYTLRDGQSVRLLSAPLFVMVGGNSGWISVGELEDRPILLCESAAPEVGDDTVTVQGGVKCFAMVNGTVEIQESAAYTEVIDISDHAPADPVRYGESSAVIQGVWHPYEDFLDWKHSFVLLATNCGFAAEDWDDDAVPYAAARGYCESGFWDVEPDSWYTAAVRWAAETGVTTGTSPERFSPADTCTRAQFVTFLWRAEGRPGGGSVPFSDVGKQDYFYDAVSWAVSRKITEGVGANRFAPEETLTRAQVVTFLWRIAGSPRMPESQKFQDVEAGSWYAPAVAWAVRAGVTQGTGTNTFSPEAPCTRDQAVTFLFRQYTDN